MGYLKFLKNFSFYPNQKKITNNIIFRHNFESFEYVSQKFTDLKNLKKIKHMYFLSNLEKSQLKRFFFNKSNFSEMYLNSIFKRGNKLKALKHFNFAVAGVEESLLSKSDFFRNKFKSLDIVNEFIFDNNEFNIEFIFDHLFNLNYMIFNLFMYRKPKQKK